MVLMSESASANLLSDKSQHRSRFFQILACLMNWRVVGVARPRRYLDRLANLFSANPSDAVRERFIGAQFVSHKPVIRVRASHYYSVFRRLSPGQTTPAA